MTTSSRTALSRETSTSAIAMAVLVVALALVILVRWSLAANFGTDIPIADQWDSEIALLYKPISDGTFTATSLVAPHNEHRILFTRVLGAALFVANHDQFDNLVELFFNAIVYAAAMAFVVGPIVLRLRGSALALAGLAAIAVGTLPYAWENLVSGFQNAFFFLHAFAAAALAMLVLGRDSTVRHAVIALLCLASLFTLASGLLTAFTVGVIASMRLRDDRMTVRGIVLLVVLPIAIGVLGIVVLPTVAGHETLRANGVVDLLGGAATLFAWPLPRGVFGALLLWSPSVLWSIGWLRKRTRTDDTDGCVEFYLFALATWTAMQIAAIAWSRGHALEIVPTRYLDTLVIGAIANVALGALMLQRARGARARSALFVAIVGGGSAVMLCLGAWGFRGAHVLSGRLDGLDVAADSVRGYLGGAGGTAFDGKGPHELPYPSAARLAVLLDDETIRRLLPPSIREPLALSMDHCGSVSMPGPGIFATSTTTGGDMAQGTCTSAPLATTFPFVRIGVANYAPKAELALELVAGAGAIRVPYSDTPAADRWEWQHARVPDDAFRLRMTDHSPDRSFAFSQPIEQGRLSTMIATWFDRLRRWP